MDFSVTKNGKVVSEELYRWDAVNKVFASDLNDLVIDFGIESNITFKTRSNCTFNTGAYCTFDTGAYCTFKTGDNCTFDTGCDCTFDTGCDCTFGTEFSCTFGTGSSCTFKAEKGSIIVRREIFEVIHIPEDKTIKLNGYMKAGYTIVEKIIMLDGKEVKISLESLNALKEFLKEGSINEIFSNKEW